MTASSEKMVKVTLVRSAIGFDKTQKAAARALGLTKRFKTVEWPDSPSIRGQIRKIQHLVEVAE
ncbi:MAG: 50S ribosomal protein L30 [Candidatus Sericytochromatia bacterium]|nr:50S ribosomal protein L30 [Candidatus Sericytochromatia bacterium]